VAGLSGQGGGHLRRVRKWSRVGQFRQAKQYTEQQPEIRVQNKVLVQVLGHESIIAFKDRPITIDGEDLAS
jgi:hypothetical protein